MNIILHDDFYFVEGWFPLFMITVITEQGLATHLSSG